MTPLEPPLQHEPLDVELPAPSVWPVVLAFGVTLIAAGLVTHVGVSLAGGLALIIAAAGWFREVWPIEATETVVVSGPPPVIMTTRVGVARLRADDAMHRARLPIEIYPVSAGIRGGLAGGAVMAVLAMVYGAARWHSVWYPVNLLAAGLFPAVAARDADLAAFDVRLLLAAAAIHAGASLLVGLLYGATLPMMPRRPILLGGLLAPLVWTGLLYTSLDIINPLMRARIDWGWFTLSQIGFGLVAGVVVSRHERIATLPALGFAARAGLHTPREDDIEGER